jgi:hypothetical protein
MQEKSYKKATNSCKATGQIGKAIRKTKVKGHGYAERANHNSKSKLRFLPKDANQILNTLRKNTFY